jgi:anti-sigma regulatory factor (Ser/Thr protein kinase)
MPTKAADAPRAEDFPFAQSTMAEQSAHVTVTADEDVFAARRSVRSVATSLGFSARVAEELALVASELASNMLKYAGGGEMHIAACAGDASTQVGICIAARDTAPPFDLACALHDGHDGAGQIDPALLFGRRGIGAGLGAVARLTDALTLEETPDGKRLVAVRYLRSSRS